MKRRPRFLVPLVALAALLAVLLFAAACGSSTGDTSTTLAAVSPSAAPQTTAGPATTATTSAATAPAATAAETATTAASDSGSTTSGTIVVKGMVDNPLTLTVESLKAMNPVTITAEHPKLGKQQYTGVRFSDLLAALKVQAGATTLDLASSDGYMAEVSLADLKASADAMIAIGDDGTLNAVMPGLSGKAWAKDLVSLEFK